MTNRMALAIGVSVVLVLAVTSVQAQMTKPFKMTISGAGNIPLGTEINGQPITLGICGGHSNLGGGTYDCTTTGYDIHTDWSPTGTGPCAGGLETQYLSIVKNHIIRFAGGDMLYMVPDLTAGPNYACYFPVEGYGVDVKTWRIVGGSGRFEGATGAATWELKGDFLPLGDPPEDVMFGVHRGPFEGYITLAE